MACGLACGVRLSPVQMSFKINSNSLRHILRSWLIEIDGYMQAGDAFKENLKAILGNREPKRIASGNSRYREASVLVPLFRNDGRFWLLFTKRASTMEYHKGEVSFPGGRVDSSDDTHERTALRETFEEIGVREEDIEILGRLDDMTTLTSQFIIHPFVGMIRFPYSFHISRKEVERLIEVPLEFFFNPSQPLPYSIEYRGGRIEIPAFIYGDAVIWGATERILENFIGLIGQRIEF
jgi:8-oxo-dGTP pyrophosphatase MutT (NUDIX family)